ncbi:hypothetical protein BGX23_010716 [Mortierella sp. AD031]|nr:hypothetical protein BGX23_010716 [Mortierella sp. AD031]
MTAPGLVRFLAIQSPAITGLQSLCLLGNEASPFEATPLPLVHPPEGVDAVNIDTPDALVALLLHNKNLRSLTIGDNFLHPYNSMDVFFQVMSSFPASCLEALDISSTYTTTDSYFERELGKLRDLNRMHDTMVQLHRAHQPFMALKELAISGRKGNRINYSRLAFIGRCTQVERIRLFQLDDWVILALSKAFQMFCPRLTQLEWTGCIENGGEEIARVLRSSQSGWKTIKLDVMNDFDDLASEALMESVRTTLEEIKVNCWGQMSEVNHLDILCSGSRLRRFEGAGHGERIGNSLQATIHAYDAFMEHSQGVKGRTWALGPSIEYLQLRIVGVPRPDVVCRQSGKPFLEPLVELDDCNRYDVQRYIYEQLGRMSNLHDLVLGCIFAAII